MPVFEGVGVALVTLFDDGGDLDAPATAALAARLVDAGVTAVVVAGSTGEAAALEPGERTRLIEAVRLTVERRATVIAGTGAPSARQAVGLTVAAVDAGADAVLALSPPFADDPRPYYDAVAEAAGALPVLAYHFPRVSAPGIRLADVADLPVAGIKDSSGEAGRLNALVAAGVETYAGSAHLVAHAAAIGCPGAILAAANAAPERCVAAWGGDASAQLDLAAVERAASARFPGGIKRLAAERWGTSPAARMG